MNKRREKPDGLPFRVYERRGEHIYSIGYKLPTGVWAFRLKCNVGDRPKIAALRDEAIKRSCEIRLGKPAEDTVDALITAWFKWQEEKPDRKSTRLNSSHVSQSRMPSSA